MSRTLHLQLRALAAAIVVTTACAADDTIRPHGDVDFSRMVAIGNSISMGWMNDGVVGESQVLAWPNLLATATGASFSTPRIAAPGCSPALMSPLGTFARIDGSSVTEDKFCAPLAADVTLPASNLAIEGATAVAALTETPEAPLAGRDRPAVVSRVLPAGQTQVAAMKAAHPTFVTVDFGGNEVLPAQVGLLVPNVTFTPFGTFQAAYAQILDSVKATGARALLMALPHDIRQFPTIRTGAEIAAQRAAFLALNVSVAADCDDSPNFIFVRGKVLVAVASGAAYASAGAGPYTLSCADVPGTPDYVLTPSDITAINDLLAQMNVEIITQATTRGYAVTSLDALYANSKSGVPFDLQAYLGGPQPYGPLIGLDGVHPNGAGQEVLANAAILAINVKYGTHISAR